MTGETGGALGSWLAHSGASEAEVRRQTVEELHHLLGLDLSAMSRDERASLPDFFEALGRRLERGPAELLALVKFLAPDRQRPGQSLAEALAEILVVPRLRRTEYLGHQGSLPPWEMGRLLLEYALWSVRLDHVLGALTKGFCAGHCQRLPVGCCSVLGYDMGLVPRGMLRAQQLEARAGGWTPPRSEEHCKYHGPRGCCLRLFKSPACAGMLCDELVAHLGVGHDEAALAAFLAPLAQYRNHVLDREAIFQRMAEVVAAGEALP